MQRVMVIGCSGAGKSTFARAIADVTGLPLVHLDQIYWQAGWIEAPRSVFTQCIAAEAAEERWIMDGTNTSTFDLRIPRADRIYWLRRTRIACIRRVLWRVATTYGRVRPDMAAGCPEKFDLEFLRYVWTFESKFGPRIAAALDQHDAWGRTNIITSDAEAQDAIGRVRLS